MGPVPFPAQICQQTQSPIDKTALTGLSMGERTGSRVLQWVWSYVIEHGENIDYNATPLDLTVRLRSTNDCHMLHTVAFTCAFFPLTVSRRFL
ncbi:hypothetical protein LZ30DRAFT_606140 [Colletotrichum cereale]|nr:hypothetical protein LZ30DRAFT_606140 [Colletotrichum cereale]